MGAIQLKPLKGEYIQYLREDNITEVQDFFGDDNGINFIYDGEANEYYITAEGDEAYYVREGQYIVKLLGDYAIYDREVFEELFDLLD